MRLNIRSQCDSHNIQKGIVRAVNAPLYMYPEELDTKKGTLNSHLFIEINYYLFQ